MKYFILANILLLTFFAMFFWFPKGRALSIELDALQLLEQRYYAKESNFNHLNENQQDIEAMQADVANSPVKLLPYSGLIMLFSNMQSMAKRLGLKETDLSADEPVFYDTGLGRVALIKGVVSFSGAHESLCIMAESMIDSPCLVESLSVSKDKGTLSVSFSLFGIDES